MEDRVSLVLADCGRTLDHSRRMVWELATRLPRNRFHLRVWLSSAPAMDDFAHALEARAILVERIHDPDPPSGWRTRFEVRRRVFGARPTLMHLFSTSPCAERLTSVLGEAAGAARVVFTRGSNVSGSSGAGPLRRVIERADSVTAPTESAADALVRDHGVRRSSLRIVSEGVDLPEEGAEQAASIEWRERFGASPVRPLWVSFARGESERETEVLLEALVEVRRRAVPFVLAVVGSTRHRDRLERRIGELGLASCVRIADGVNDPGPLLSAAEIVILPLPDEGQPRLLMEALARGRPVIAGETPAVTEILQNGVDGRLVPPGDSAALADAIEGVYRRPDAARRMAARAAYRMHDEYSWQRMVEAYEEVYDEVLGLASFAPERERAARDA